MSFFRRDSPPLRSGAGTPAASAATGERGAVATTVAAGTRIEGKVGGATHVVIEGEVEGEVQLAGDLLVAPGGRIVGSVEARTVRILGAVEGNVRGRERVELAATGSLTGDVAAAKVVISEGAFFKGKVEMQGADAAGPAAPARSPS